MDAKIMFGKAKDFGTKIVNNEHVKKIALNAASAAVVTTAAILVTAGVNALLDSVKNGLAAKHEADRLDSGSDTTTEEN